MPLSLAYGMLVMKSRTKSLRWVLLLLIPLFAIPAWYYASTPSATSDMSGVHLSITAATDPRGKHILTITVDNQTGGAIYIPDAHYMTFTLTQEGDGKQTTVHG